MKHEQSNLITGILHFSDVEEVLKLSSPSSGNIFIDCTFGGGGYSKEILKISETNIHAIDRDKKTLPTAKELKKIST